MRRLLCFLFIPALAACDGGTDAPTFDGPFGDVLDSVCDTLDRCPEAFGRPIAYRDRDECRAIIGWATTCRLTEVDVGDASTYGVEQSIPEVDPEVAQACREWLAEASCEDITLGEDGPCAGLIVSSDDDDDDTPSGSAGVDETCYGDDECQADLYCTPGGSDRETGTFSCQVCRPRLGAGSACRQFTRECQDGLHCRYIMDGPRACAPLDADGVECVEHEQCVSGFCNYARVMTGGLGLCDSAGNEGDPCDEPGSCRGEFYCDATCQVRRDHGAACTDDAECANYNCDETTSVCGAPDGAGCSRGSECASGTCGDAGVCGGTSSGGGCSSDEDCAAGELCNWDTDSCVSPQPDGSACRRDEECSSSWCTFDDRCATRPGLGDACDNTYDCPPTAFCSGGTCIDRIRPGERCEDLESCLEPFLCRNGTCELINLACVPARAGEGCAFLRVCDEESYCDFFDGITCRARSGEGEVCSPSPLRGIEVCRAGLHCSDDGTGTGNMTCRPRVAIGESCETSVCVEGAYCFEGTCQGPPLGQPCDYDVPCPSGFFCGDREEVCLPPGGEGASCDESDQCQAELFCEYGDCVARRPLGEECRDPEECQHALFCDSDTYTCATDLAAGAPCDSRDEPCPAGHFCPSGADPVCTRQAMPGEDCDFDGQCMSGACYESSWCLAVNECVLPE